MREEDIGGPAESENGNSTSQVLDAGEGMPLKSGVDGSEKNIHILHGLCACF